MKTQALGRRANTVPASTNSDLLDFTADSCYAERKSVLKILVTSTQDGTFYAKVGDATDSIGSLPHTFSEPVTANTSLLLVIPWVPGCTVGRLYLANGSGGAATYVFHAGIEEA